MTGTSLAAFKSAGLPANDMSAFKAKMQQATQAAKRAVSGGLLLRLLKDGGWVYGADNVDVQDGSLWAVNPFSMSMGFAAWGEEKTPNQGVLMGERMALITEEQISFASLPNCGAPWKAQVSCELVCVFGDDTGTEVLYKTTSVGGARAYAGLLAEVSAQLDGEDGTFVPIVELKVDSYQNKKWGKTYVPVFEIVEWKTPEDTTLGGAAADDAADQPEGDAPAETTQTADASAQTAETKPAAEAQPARARRGAAAAAQPAKRPAATGGATKPAAVIDRGAVVRRRRAS